MSIVNVSVLILNFYNDIPGVYMKPLPQCPTPYVMKDLHYLSIHILDECSTYESGNQTLDPVSGPTYVPRPS